MALVAYASSDSGCSDDEEDNEAANLTRSVEIVNKTVPLNDPTAISNGGANTLVSSADLTGDPHISDEEDIYPLPNSAGGQGLSLPAPKHSTQLQAENEVVFAEDEGRSHSGLLAGLPQPRSAGTRDGEKEDTMVEDELEDIVKPKAVELALQEKPPAKKKTRQPVKIVIPALQDGEREEDKEPSRKKMRPAPGKSGLLAFLPPPQQTITKETNRILIPHTLSKKPMTASTHKPTTTPTHKPAQTLPSRASPSTKVTSLLPGINATEDSEDDEDEDNPSPCFFSFGDSRKAAPVNPRDSVDVVQPVGAIAGPALRPQGSGPALRPQRSESQNESETNQADAPLEFRDLADAPLQFSQTRPSYPASHYGPSTANAWSQSREGAQPYQFSDNQSEAVACPDSQGSDAALQIESDQLLRLQGRRCHGREEIHIIDVHGDDQRSEVEVTRNLTEEQNECHSRKKKDLPTRQQKTKHQITYLAYKAKEREFDLKNQWAQNKTTRRQTQAKYGF